jgi:hypothetical protein
MEATPIENDFRPLDSFANLATMSYAELTKALRNADQAAYLFRLVEWAKSEAPELIGEMESVRYHSTSDRISQIEAIILRTMIRRGMIRLAHADYTHWIDPAADVTLRNKAE